jgi:SNF family Na+-dependent transporter
MPAVAFMEDEFNLTRREACLFFGIVTFVLCQPVIFFYGNGVLDEMDFWGVMVGLVVFATVESILFGWVFGMERAWTELHSGSDIRIPGIYRVIIKYVTPVFLMAILATWFVQDWMNILLMKNVPAENRPFVLITRLGLLGLFVFLCVMVWVVWRRRERESVK